MTVGEQNFTASLRCADHALTDGAERLGQNIAAFLHCYQVNHCGVYLLVSFGARRATPSTTMIRQFRQPAGLFRSGWRELLNDLLKKRVAAERVPEGEGLEDSVVGAERCVDSRLNDGTQLLDR